MAENMYPPVLRMGSGAIRVSAVGDSLTYGYGLEDRSLEAYPSILADLLGDHYQVANYGLAGRSLQASSDYPYFQEENGRQSLEDDCDLVLIMLGTNDTRPPYWNARRFQREYEDMIKRYQTLPSQPDIFLLVPPFLPTDRYGLDNQVLKNEIRPMLYNIASAYSLPLVDLYQITEGREDLYSDGLHLSVKGNRLIAETLYQSIC